MVSVQLHDNLVFHDKDPYAEPLSVDKAPSFEIRPQAWSEYHHIFWAHLDRLAIFQQNIKLFAHAQYDGRMRFVQRQAVASDSQFGHAAPQQTVSGETVLATYSVQAKSTKSKARTRYAWRREAFGLQSLGCAGCRWQAADVEH